MAYKRILTIQDISCAGQCSMTVALPILSACGHETCILPTAVLSTHTGGFGRPAVMYMDEILPEVVKHWQENDITFDAVLIGYLGSVAAIETASQIIGTMLAPGGISIVDPVMGDHGKLYSGFDDAYARAMEQLCRKADILIPNITEAAILAGAEYREILDEDYVNRLLTALNHSCVLLTGVGYSAGETGVLLREGDRQSHYRHPRLGKGCHGTGDIFAACFTGALMQGKSKADAMKIAADFTCLTIEKTVENPAHWYGIKFEAALPWLICQLQ